MIEEFRNFIKKESLITTNECTLLTVSGGIDSMAMLHLFIEAKYKIAVAHCNFGLRGHESDGDEELVKQICLEKNITFFSHQFETLKYANENKVSTQMAARELRYNWFNKIAAQYKYQLIATAHHQNDIAETMLINITRGTGISGLHGILPKKNNIIRPLLFATKQQIEAYVNNRQIKFRADSSNKKTDYWRNKIRLEVMPILTSLNKNVVNNFYALSNRIKIDELLLQDKINELKKIYINVNKEITYIDLKIKQHYAAKTLLFYVLNEFGFIANDIFQLTDNHNIEIGAIFESKTHLLLVDRKHLVIKERKVAVINQTLDLGKNSVIIETPIGNIQFETLSEYPIQFFKTCLYLDKHKTGNEFTLHTWQQGDRFKPLGMKGSKLVSDYLIDKKINQFEKNKCLILTCKKTNEIAAVIPYQISNDYKLNNDAKNILKISFD
jgi:tRNA(Ile)-lysidine synthase